MKELKILRDMKKDPEGKNLMDTPILVSRMEPSKMMKTLRMVPEQQVAILKIQCQENRF
jgi:hypothetical protein